jgi:RNA polymerase sigma-70 factor, ECF subfamily
MRKCTHSLWFQRIRYKMLTAAALPHIPVSEEQILAQARSGSEIAFASIVREHQAMVFGLAYHFLQSRAEAEELAQDVFLALHQNLSRVESAKHLVFWLRRVTSNRCIDCVRSSQRRRELPMDDLHEPGETPRFGDPLLHDLLRSLVAELAPDARIVVTLRFQEDLDLSEIAAIVDMPVNTVKSHLRRSMDALRRKLAARGHVYES